jgi:pimeloyl-ACP methyl ester carboxylesterase
MEHLVEVAHGSDDIVVGISGFGSASVGSERWEPLAALTGRTTVALKYDAQELPFPAGPVTLSFPPPTSLVSDFHRRWDKARAGARVASDYLAKWLRRWTQAGRKVLIVAFSLGSYVAWNAIRQVPSDNIELVMISAAIVDRPEEWAGMEKLGRVFNVYSRDDWALKLLYPYGVGADETPAAGLGPLTVTHLDNVVNIDVTDMVGRDHLWASQNVKRLIQVAMGCYWGTSLPGDTCTPLDLVQGPAAHLSGPERQRLYRWLLIDPSLWELLGLGLTGSGHAVEKLQELDRWSMRDERMWSLLEAGIATRALIGPFPGPVSEMTADRSRMQLRGLLREWLYAGSVERHPGEGLKSSS